MPPPTRTYSTVKKQTKQQQVKTIEKKEVPNTTPPHHTPALQAKFRTFTDIRIKVLTFCA